MTDDNRQPNEPDRDDSEREQPVEDAPSPLIEDGDSVDVSQNGDIDNEEEGK